MGLRIQTRSTFAHSAGEKRGTAYDFIKTMFAFTKPDEVSSQVIRYLACMPKGEVEMDDGMIGWDSIYRILLFIIAF